ncbi:trp RNA-binding attenuation protein MtrB [Gemella cuniculi]|uniref:trp RNA-binding attenuation protein MtrB n=1 Tax=Gemella cuniculi TaxID=150240 RepID=UPI00040F5A08|nr:trp RNA-binding attenuation protein MtrB [Gemella cuniculi]
MKQVDYIIIRAEVDNVKVITKKLNNEEVLEILNKGEVIILNIFENIVNFKVQGRARIVSNLDQVISE